eukprot:Protomagalhaensia_sp_Gyna_25__5969@NODE_924_length_2415_cov_14_531987_g730_i0_p1_GENE_NODE_924_length_2415_cov_14_531987_g730_i0NODE_924_length_2415_cov_14_531987_g730_i0_p1_ORF_typecomplete_len362_score51_24cobW/PF02492_19/3_7e35CobW_C/PF07683_14/3_8e03CobW_C/PF07683_14/5_9e08AAA_22/PF13401_6/0_0065SRPRB/PF09439_10/0_049TsaE/PF02367_17/0_0076RsgA_GTPase/PF03193_16/18RsgA_GTPase/PF03193_16/1AAA_16/PF13191_6/0_028AAA_33/PF13671_6/0_03Arf/PF00025_21/2_6Arf/PF00025_21/41Rad17/PF03215_15/0_14TniB/PF
MSTLKTPVVILTGFLGAGKTTLLRRCMLNTEDLRIALIRNEFAEEELSFECPLLMREEDDFSSFWEFPNSCVCCTLKSQFVQGVSNMVIKAQAAGKPFDLVLLEISGLADPLAAAASLVSEGDPADDVIRLGAIVSIVDASSIDSRLDHKSAQALVDSMAKRARSQELVPPTGELKLLLMKQICSSSLVILNKRDLVSDPQLESLRDLLTHLAIDAQIICTSFCEFDLKLLLTICERPLELEQSLISMPTIHSHDIQNIGQGISIPGLVRLVWQSEKPIDLAAFETALLRFAWSLDGDAQLLRAKGMITERGSEKRFEMQFVKDSLQFSPVSTNSSSTSRCLFIGLHLPLASLEETLLTFE